jgi:predicted phage tail protein
MPVPDFSPGEVLTAAAMDSIGLWRVASATVSVASTAIDGCFTSDYQNYVVVVNIDDGAGGPAQVQIAMRIGGVTTTGSSYFSYYRGITWAGGNDNTANNGGGNWFALRTNGDSLGFAGVVEMLDPQRAVRTRFVSHGSDGSQRWYAGGMHDSTTQFDGFVMTSTSGAAMAGTITVYGYRKP